jgi:hypothetical protein
MRSRRAKPGVNALAMLFDTISARLAAADRPEVAFDTALEIVIVYPYPF